MLAIAKGTASIAEIGDFGQRGAIRVGMFVGVGQETE